MITDWAGNEIKPGMEIAFLQTVIHHSHAEMWWPAIYSKDNKPFKQVIQEAHDEPCWLLSEFRVVEGSDDDLYVTIKTPSDWPEKGCTIFSQVKLGVRDFFETGIPVVVIKGISDTKPDKT